MYVYGVLSLFLIAIAPLSLSLCLPLSMSLSFIFIAFGWLNETKSESLALWRFIKVFGSQKYATKYICPTCVLVCVCVLEKVVTAISYFLQMEECGDQRASKWDRNGDGDSHIMKISHRKQKAKHPGERNSLPITHTHTHTCLCVGVFRSYPRHVRACCY